MCAKFDLNTQVVPEKLKMENVHGQTGGRGVNKSELLSSGELKYHFKQTIFEYGPNLTGLFLD